MAKTGAHLKIQQFGDEFDVLGVTLRGDPRCPEPDEFRVAFPGGEVSVVRTTDGEYWAHITVNHPEQGLRYKGDGVRDGFVVDGRVDVMGKHATECAVGDLDNPDAYHVALRVATKRKE